MQIIKFLNSTAIPLLLGLICVFMLRCRESEDDDVVVELDHPAESTLAWERRGPDIEAIAHEPNNYSLCPNVYLFETFESVKTWGWAKAEINGILTYGIAYAIKDLSTESEDDYLLLVSFTDFDRCIGRWDLVVRDMYWPIPQRDSFSHKALIYSCEYIDNRIRRVWNEAPGRVAHFSLLDHDTPLQNYHPDTTAGTRLRYVLDQVDTARSIAVGRFVGRFYADPSCPLNAPESQEVTLERGYFQANILPD